MSRYLKSLACLVCVLGLVGDVQAQPQAEVTWTDTTGDHNWFTPGNWDSGGVPTFDDGVIISTLPGPTIAHEGAIAFRVFFRYGTGALTVDGGILESSHDLTVPRSDHEGTLNMISGTITVGLNFWVGRFGPGTLNMTGDQITANNFVIGDQVAGSGHVNLDGGIITTETFSMRINEGSVGTMNVTGGTLIINGDNLSTVQGYIDNGWITAYDGKDTPQLDYDVTNPGKTTLKCLPPDQASNPSPADEATDVPRDVVLSWTPGTFAASHDVYFGSSFDDVNDATTGSAEFKGNQTELVYDVAQILEFGTTYFWRIDEVNDADPNSPWKGKVLSFEVEPEAILVARDLLMATASSQGSDEDNPDNTISNEGLNEDGSHSQDTSTMWRSDTSAAGEAWIRYDLSQSQKLLEMLVWNHNSSLEPDTGWGIKDALIEVSTDGVEFTTFGTVELAQSAETVVDMQNTVAQSVRITAQSNWGGFFPK
ncbi:discoidin domain-containing protein, partial [Planctomycetota bacterium]